MVLLVVFFGKRSIGPAARLIHGHSGLNYDTYQVIEVNMRFIASVCDFSFSRYCCNDCFSWSHRTLCQLTRKLFFTSSSVRNFVFPLFARLSTSRYFFVTVSSSCSVEAHELIITSSFSLNPAPPCRKPGLSSMSFEAFLRWSKAHFKLKSTSSSSFKSRDAAFLPELTLA